MVGKLKHSWPDVANNSSFRGTPKNNNNGTPGKLNKGSPFGTPATSSSTLSNNTPNTTPTPQQQEQVIEVIEYEDPEWKSDDSGFEEVVEIVEEVVVAPKKVAPHEVGIGNNATAPAPAPAPTPLPFSAPAPAPAPVPFPTTRKFAPPPPTRMAFPNPKKDYDDDTASRQTESVMTDRFNDETEVTLGEDLGCFNNRRNAPTPTNLSIGIPAPPGPGGIPPPPPPPPPAAISSPPEPPAGMLPPGIPPPMRGAGAIPPPPPRPPAPTPHTLPTQTGRTSDAMSIASSLGDIEDARKSLEVDRIAAQEKSAICRLRIGVFLFLTLAGLTVALAVYFAAAQNETQRFRDGFQQTASHLVDTLEKETSTRFGIVQNLAQEITQYYDANNNNNFAFSAGQTAELADLVALTLVTNNNNNNSNNTWTPKETYPEYLQSDENWRATDLALIQQMVATQEPVFTETKQVSWDVMVLDNNPSVASYYPVFETLEFNAVTAFLKVGMDWTSFLVELLPDKTSVQVVLANNCDQSYTYLLEGEEAFFVGVGEQVQGNYKDQAVSYTLNQPPEDSTTTTTAGCYYDITVYPTQQLEDSYKTNTPLIFAITLIAVLLLASVVFLLYDATVEKRQKKVLAEAQRSAALVQSLFPEEVRDRIYREQEQAQAQSSRVEELHKSWKNPPKVFGVDKSQAIATMHPNCTILFADISGFTKWSSSRTPVEVFDLLEAMYGVFDRIARRRKVFKVETIGDCYVAATGLPQPQEDHAVRMARFADNCMRALQGLIVTDLVDRLGKDTADLAMRFGLHSGPVTAGVLRGERQRFQIFGDTVNTAARMESNGIREKIHVSESCAECIRRGGKEDWLEMRQDKVQAKGKGLMQTYYVNVISRGDTHSASSYPSTSQLSISMH